MTVLSIFADAIDRYHYHGELRYVALQSSFDRRVDDFDGPSTTASLLNIRPRALFDSRPCISFSQETYSWRVHWICFVVGMHFLSLSALQIVSRKCVKPHQCAFVSHRLARCCFSWLYLLDMNMDLENDPDFVAFIKKNNLNDDVLKYIQSKIIPPYIATLDQMEAAAKLAIRKAQQDALNGIIYDMEDQPPATNGYAPASVLKDVGRGHTMNAPCTVARAGAALHSVGTKKKATRSSAVKKTTNCTAGVSDDREIPKGMIRLEIVESNTTSTIVGAVQLVKPLPESTKLQKRHVKIGRSTGDQYVNYGFSIQDDEVSTNHAVIYRKNNKFYWKDMHSTNGSVANFGNGEREHMQGGELYPLRSGMKIEMGACMLKVDFCPA